MKRLGKKERSWREGTYPKCSCGSTLSIATQRAGGRLCARCEREADADAAPELLDACREALNALLDYVPTLEKRGATMGYGRAVIRKLQDAITAAEEER